MVGNGILAFAVIFVVVIFIYMSLRLQKQKDEDRNFIETYTITLEKGFIRVPRFFRIALEDNDNTMIMNSSENFNPELEEQTSTEYKDILIRN